MADRDPDPEADGRRDDERRAFDDIVERLDLDLPFPLGVDQPRDVTADVPRDATDEPVSFDDQPDPVDEQFYRRVDAGPVRPMERGRTIAWIGLLGAPLLVTLATLSGIVVSRPALLGSAFTFVASAIYLIAQLPEHGPAQRDWPDDGAAL